MKGKRLSLIAIAGIVLLFASAGFANVPAPPVNQILGFDDTEFNFLIEDDCRLCHGVVADDHHLLYGSSMIGPGECSENIGICDVSGDDCVADADCPTGETCVDQPEDACYINDECSTAIDVCSRGEPCGTCSVSGESCGQDVDCPTGETCVDGCPTYHGVPGQCGQPVCVGGSMAPNNPNAGVYGCLTCHEQAVVEGVITFKVERDCMVCHEYRGGATVHHLDSTVTGAKAGICNTCHGDLVDNIVGCDPLALGNCSDTNLTCGADSDCKSGACSVSTDVPCFDDTDCELLGVCNDVAADPCDSDADCISPATCIGGGETCVGGGLTTCDLATCDHEIPTYTPSLVTPHPAGGEEGTCDYCHAPGLDTASGVNVHDNHDTHHHVGIQYFADGSRLGDRCSWCHQEGRPGRGDPGTEIRTCENCHGYASLHNIQADSDDPADGIEVLGEAYGYGHIGIDDPAGDSDCWGCHGFSTSADPQIGSGVPSISNVVPASITAGTPTQVTVTGAALISTVPIATSDVRLTAADGSSVTITPDSIIGDVLTVTINAAAGSYTLQAVKDGEASNAVGISITPQVVITDASCNDGIITITGSGFGDAPPEGSEEYLNVVVDGVPAEIISWTDTEITVSVSDCNGTVTVNALYGSDTFGDACQADFNSDGAVDLFDLIIMIVEFGSTDCDTCQADCDGDGDVDINDLIILVIEFGKGGC